MAIGSGLGSQLGYEPETTYGTTQTPVTNFLEAKKVSIVPQVQHMESPALRYGTKVLRADRQVVNRKGAAGDVDLDVTSNNMARWWRHAMNDDRAYTSIKTTPSASVYLYTYNIGDPAACPSLTLQAGIADSTGSVRRMDTVGAFINSWQLQNKIDGILESTFSIDARDTIPSSSAPTTATYSSSSEVLTFAGGVATVAGTATNVKSIDLKCTMGMSLDRYQISGSTLKSRPILDKMTEITGTIELEFGYAPGTWATSDLVSKYRAGTTIAFDATWTGATAIASTYFPYLEATSTAAMITKADVTVVGPVIVMMSVYFKVLDDGSNPPLVLKYQSSENITS